MPHSKILRIKDEAECGNRGSHCTEMWASHIKINSDVHTRVGTPHINMSSDVHTKVGTSHMKICSDVHVHIMVGTPHVKCIEMESVDVGLSILPNYFLKKSI